MLIAISALFAASAAGQKRKTTKPKTTPKTTAASTISAAAEVSSAKEKVSNQIKNVTRFIGVLGPVAQNIESIDKDAKSKRVDQKAIDQNAQNKKKVITAIQNLRAGLSALETEFSTKPSLRRFLLKIEGISALSAQSEDSAVAGRFTEARSPLTTVVEKLSDTLAVMP
jgi:hypothetical protein